MIAPRILTGGLATALAAVTLAVSPGPPRLPRSVEGEVAFVNVRVLPMDSERALEDQTVLIRGNRIVAVGPTDSVTISPGAARIDGRGMTLMPGLADLHVHLYSEADLLNYLAHGVTTVLDLNGSPRTRAWRERVALGEIDGPTLYVAGPSLNGYPPGNPTFTALDDPARAAFEVRRQEAAGYDILKVYSTLAPEVFAAVIETAAVEEMAVVGHVPLAVGLEGAIEAGQIMIAHGEEYWKLLRDADPAGLAAAIRRTLDAGAYVTPNLSALDRILDEAGDLGALVDDPEAAYVSPAAYSEWLPSNNRYADRDTARFLPQMRQELAFVSALTGDLFDAGVPLLVGTDSPVVGFAGASAGRELALLVEAGLSPYEAIAAATRNAGAFVAETIHEGERFGRITAGYRADLLLVDGDPLADVGALKRIRGVMARGVWHSAEEIGRLRDQRARRYEALHGAVEEIDRLIDEHDVDRAIELYRATVEANPGTELIAEAMFLVEGRALLDGDRATEALDLFRLSAEAYPLSPASWVGVADARAALGDTAGALQALVHARELRPSDAGVRDRLARIEASGQPPSFEVAGIYHLSTRARVDGEHRDVSLTLRLERGTSGWTGSIETDAPLPVLEVTEVTAGGNRLWVAAPLESSSLVLRLVVEGTKVYGWWNIGYAEQGLLRGEREGS